MSIHKESKPRLRPIIAHDQSFKVVYLQWSSVSSGLIVKAKTSIAFSQQTGGYACLPLVQEGVLWPLTLAPSMTASLDKIFLEKYGGWCDNGIDEQDADFLDSIFREHSFPLTVDRTLLNASKEAWIHVILTTVDENSDEQFHGLLEFSGAPGVFLFENSD